MGLLEKYNCYKQKVMYYDYLSSCYTLNMKTLQNRRNIADSLFLNKIMHNKVNCPYLVNQFLLRVPEGILRHMPPFATKYRLLCRKNSFMPRVLDMANRFCLYDDLITKAPTVFKNLSKVSFNYCVVIFPVFILTYFIYFS